MSKNWFIIDYQQIILILQSLRTTLLLTKMIVTGTGAALTLVPWVL